MILAIAVFMLINYYLQMISAHNDIVRSSKELFWQIEQIVKQNNEELEIVKEEFNSTCKLRAKAAAYIVEKNPEVREDLNELKKVTNMLEVDEIHIFDEEGNLYYGSNPEYWGMSMHSGEQIGYFLPMLEDKTLSMCQEITPNTADGILMQYAAAWCEDGSNIVQIGMTPERVLKQTEKNELSYIFSLLTNEGGDIILALDPADYTILGSTNDELMGKKLTDLGIDKEQLDEGDRGFHTFWNGEYSYAVFSQCDDLILGRICFASSLYSNLNKSNLRLLVYIILIFLVVIYSISRYLEKNIVTAIDDVNKSLQLIEAGNLDDRVEVHTTQEFTLLSKYINSMVESLLATTDKMSSILDITKLPMGAYEYNEKMGRVLVTKRVEQILGLSKEEAQELFSDWRKFERKLDELRSNPLDSEGDVYILSQPKAKPRYIKLEVITGKNSIIGVLIDQTEDVRRKLALEQELGEDVLTKLCSRKAFFEQVQAVLYAPDKIGNAAMVMIDSDDLKKVNDNYGHENGDKYLCGVAEALSKITAPNRIIARLSGDEFAVFIYGADSREELEAYLRELIDKRDNEMLLLEDGKNVPVRFSMGIAIYGEDGETYKVLLKEADRKMYIEKQARKKYR